MTDTATERDAVYDLASALETVDGAFGSETTRIESVELDVARSYVEVTLDSGQHFRMTVREV